MSIYYAKIKLSFDCLHGKLTKICGGVDLTIEETPTRATNISDVELICRLRDVEI